MPWTPPSDPVTSTVITVAYAVANLLTQIRWLRLMTGNADPPGTSYVCVSDSSSVTSWRKVPPDALAAGAVVGNLGYTPINKAGDAGISGSLDLNNNVSVRGRDTVGIARGLIGKGSDDNVYVGDAASGYVILSSPTGQGALLPNNTSVNGRDTAQTPRALIGKGPDNNTYVGDGNQGYVILSSPPAAGALLGNNVSLKGRDTSQNPRGLIGKGADNNTYVGDAASGTVQLLGQVNEAYVGVGTTNRLWHAGNDGTGSGLDADLWRGLPPASMTVGAATTVGGLAPTATPTPGAIPIADASGKLDAWVTASASGAFVPSGLVALWAASDTAPTGWVLDTTFRDRFVVGAGASYARSATGGATQHAHGGGSHAHSGAALGVGGSIDTASGSGNQANVVTPNPASATQAHTHTHSLDVTGSTDAAGVATDTQGHLPPYIAAHYIRKV